MVMKAAGYRTCKGWRSGLPSSRASLLCLCITTTAVLRGKHIRTQKKDWCRHPDVVVVAPNQGLISNSDNVENSAPKSIL